MPLLASTPARFDSAQIAEALGMPAPATAIDVEGFSTDTRTIEAGNCFIALKGENFNGNLYAQAAVEKGAVMCILSEEPQSTLTVPYFIVEDTVTAYGKLANAYIQRLKANGCKVIAVTGSSGKTTVKNMISHALARKFRTYCTSGNHNNHIGVPYTILHTPADTECLVLEMGMNHKGEISRLTKIGCPDLATITNIGKAHIGNLGSQDNIFRAKLEILEGMNAASGQLAFPADDPFLENLAAIPFPAERVFYSSRMGNSKADLQALDICEAPDGISFIVKSGEDTSKVDLPMTGVHNVTDALLAIHIGLLNGMTLSECADALADFVPTALRSDRVVFGETTIIRDFYNANPEAMLASLNALLLAAKDERKIALLGNMNELGDFAADAHKSIGAFCQSNHIEAMFCGMNYNDFAEGYGSAETAFATRDELIAALPRIFPTAAPCFVLIKASRGLQMEFVYDALADILK